MNSDLKKTIKFSILTFFLTTLIYTLIPTNQNIMISILPKYSLIYQNNNSFSADNIIFTKVKGLLSLYRVSSLTGEISIELDNSEDKESSLNQFVKDIKILPLVNEVFYKESKFYVENIIKLLIQDKNITEKDVYFFKNIKPIKKVVINPEDGSALLSTQSFKYSGTIKFSDDEIKVLAKKIEEQYAKLFIQKYKSGFEDLNKLIDEYYVPRELEKIDLALAAYSALRKSKSLDEKLIDEKLAKNKIIENSISIKKEISKLSNSDLNLKIIDYDSIKIFYSKAKITTKIFIPLLILLNILLLIIYIFFFKHGLKYFLLDKKNFLK